MKLIAPDYYSSFACLMGACRHNCCIGWEIDIDEDSLARYREIPGRLGARLRENIDESGECACFRLGGDERCPFLNREGLCDLILTLGEDSLCQICADHPRFRNFFSDRTEIGLGMCCEAAAALILSQKTPVALTVIDDDANENLPDWEEEELLSLRNELTQLMQMREIPLERRIAQLAETAGIDSKVRPLSEWAAFFTSLERLDEAWTERLFLLSEDCEAPVDAEWDIPFEQLMVYLLYRHMSAALDDGDSNGKIAFCVLVWRLIRAIFARCGRQTMDELIEICRLYSSEIEYSDENISEILMQLDALRA